MTIRTTYYQTQMDLNPSSDTMCSLEIFSSFRSPLWKMGIVTKRVAVVTVWVNLCNVSATE